MGECPEWFRVIQGARYLRVPPWDLADAPLFWLNAAEEAQAAEQYAAELEAKRNPAGQTR